MNNAALSRWRQRLTPEQTIWIIGIGVAISLLGDLTLYVVLPTHTEDAGIALANVGLMLSANRLIRIVLNSPIGMLIERMPRRRIAVPALFLGAFSSLLYTVPGFWPLLIGRLMWGIAWAGLWLSASTMVLDLAGGENRGRLIGRLQMWYFIGMGVSSFIGGALTDWLGYTANFTVCAVITFAGALIWWLLLPETYTGPSHVTETATGAAYTPQTQPGQPSVLPTPLITAIVLLGINWLIFLGIVGATLPLLLKERIGEEIAVIGLLIPLSTFTGALTASNQVLSLVASPLAGWLSDYSHQRWGLVIVALLLGILTTVLTAIGGGIMIVTATMIGAVATSVLQTQVMTLVGDYTQSHQRGRILGILNTVGDIGSAAGPLLAYALLSTLALAGIFWLATGVLVLVLPWALWVARHETRQLQSANPPTQAAS